MSDEKISEEKVRREHLREVNPGAHWAYLFTVLVGSLALMVLFMALLAGQ
jgi:hypothetical protein